MRARLLAKDPVVPNAVPAEVATALTTFTPETDLAQLLAVGGLAARSIGGDLQTVPVT